MAYFGEACGPVNIVDYPDPSCTESNLVAGRFYAALRAARMAELSVSLPAIYRFRAVESAGHPLAQMLIAGAGRAEQSVGRSAGPIH